MNMIATEKKPLAQFVPVVELSPEMKEQYGRNRKGRPKPERGAIVEALAQLQPGYALLLEHRSYACVQDQGQASHCSLSSMVRIEAKRIGKHFHCWHPSDGRLAVALEAG